MCGIAGLWRLNSDTKMQGPIGHYAEYMAPTLAHREPDGAGLWQDTALTIALSHRRLSIIDLSPEGHQPMTSLFGRYLIVLNGEVCVFRDLRSELANLGCVSRGHSDTEVLIEAIGQWG